jgi:hypothetical protein
VDVSSPVSTSLSQNSVGGVPYVYTKHKIEEEPEHDNWCKTNPDLSRAPVLHQKQKNQNGAGDADYHRRRYVCADMMQTWVFGLSLALGDEHMFCYALMVEDEPTLKGTKD